MAAIVNLCVDPRLDHERVRVQVAQQIERLRLPEQRIYLTNEPGGNVGSSFRNTLALLRAEGQPVAFVAVLHHDDCVAAHAGKRMGLEQTRAQAQADLTKASVDCPVLSGTIITDGSIVSWTGDDKQSGSIGFSMPSMPRMYG